MKAKLLLFGILMSIVMTSAGQSYPQFTEINNKKGETIVNELKEFAATNGLPELVIDLLINNNYDVKAYRVIYETEAANPYKQKVLVSGVVFVPVGSKYPAPLATYLHGTIGSEDEAPSRVAAENGGSNGTLIEDQTLFGWVLATDGYIAVLPDYIGLGDEDIGDNFHPFMHAQSEASATIDMLYAVKQLLTREQIPHQNRIFLSGYSQGGHAVLATQRELESNKSHSTAFDIAVSVPASGAYCLSSIQRKFMINHPDYSNPGHLPYLIFGYKEAYGPRFYPNLKKVFITDPAIIKNLYDQELTIEDIDRELEILHPGLSSNWQIMFTDEFQDDFETNWCFWRCPPIITALRANDVVDWKPRAKTRMLFCYGDEVVAPENTLAAYLIFTLVHNAPDVIPISLGTNEHTACAIPSLVLTKFLFDANLGWKSKLEKSDIEYEQLDVEDALRALNRMGIHTIDDLKMEVLAETTSIPQEVEESLRDIQIYPNPAQDHIYLEMPSFKKGIRMTVYDITGRSVASKILKDRMTRVDISGLENGMYLIRINFDGGAHIEKLIKN